MKAANNHPVLLSSFSSQKVHFLVSTVNTLYRLLNMPINLLSIIKILLVAFQTMKIPDSKVTDAEQQLADHF